jgi:hypothetical protein
MDTRAGSSFFAADWSEFLRRVEEETRAGDSGAPTPSGRVSDSAAGPGRFCDLDLLHRGLDHFLQSARRAAQAAAAVDARLAEWEESVRRWREAAEGLRQRLAKWDAPDVS